jgi:hypothetical protein
MSDLNKIIRVLFELSNAKQKEASMVTKIPLSTLNKFLNNSVTLNTNQLVSLLNYIGIDLCELLRSKVDKDLNAKKNPLFSDIESIIDGLKYDHQKQNLINLLNHSTYLNNNISNQGN